MRGRPITYRKYTIGFGKGRLYTKQYEKINIKCEKQVMKGDFDSQAKLGIF